MHADRFAGSLRSLRNRGPAPMHDFTPFSGLGGICPGPALVNLAGLSLPIVAFVAAMLAGMIGQNLFGKTLWRSRTMAPRAAEPSSLPSRADG
ncbi:DUF6691 family protein [Bradyrhizobium sp.]|uniref:DUF6691 family protein n=1 Tax=Bradyrhizobium sp. TaxID=376 RepID=UPI00391BA0D7